MIVIFDRQHFGKPNRNDMGAGVDLDGDGTIELSEQEATLTPFYYLPSQRLLEKEGHDVIIIDSGYYSDRHAQANAIARANPTEEVIYCACHINAGKGDYAAFIHDSRSGRGESIALSLSQSFQESNLSGVLRSIVRAGSDTNDWKNGYYTIKGIYSGPNNIGGVCLEPYFLDKPEHQWLTTLDGGERVAEALVGGLLKWCA